VVVITILPLKGCGILSGFILSKLLQIPKTRVYLLLILGSIIGCGILFWAGGNDSEELGFFDQNILKA